MVRRRDFKTDMMMMIDENSSSSSSTSTSISSVVVVSLLIFLPSRQHFDLKIFFSSSFIIIAK